MKEIRRYSMPKDYPDLNEVVIEQIEYPHNTDFYTWPSWYWEKEKNNYKSTCGAAYFRVRPKPNVNPLTPTP